MFLFNLGRGWNVPYIDDIGDQGVCLRAGEVNAAQVLERDASVLPPLERRILDPQMYLRDLDYPEGGARVQRLATYPWLNPGVSEYEGQGVRNWQDEVAQGLADEWPYPLASDDPDLVQRRIADCFDLQARFGVAYLIMPVPIVRDPGSVYDTQVNWIDLGVAVAEDYELPVYATLAINDICLRYGPTGPSRLLEIIVDQIGARPELDGIYVVVEQTGSAEGSNYLVDLDVARALLMLCYDLGRRLDLGVTVNYADVFGLACVAAGANSFCGGPTTKCGRLCIGDYVGGGFGAPPKFYAHSLVLNLLPIRDIEQKIAKAGLLRLIEDDETSHSAALFEALRSGNDVSEVLGWREELNNTTVSHRHYVELVARVTRQLIESEDKESAVLMWLQDAERDASYLHDRFDDEGLYEGHRHIKVWRAAFESYLQDRAN